MTEGAAEPDALEGGEAAEGGDLLAEHPEIYVGGAFAGGLAVALALRLLGR